MSIGNIFATLLLLFLVRKGMECYSRVFIHLTILAVKGCTTFGTANQRANFWQLPPVVKACEWPSCFQAVATRGCQGIPNRPIGVNATKTFH